MSPGSPNIDEFRKEKMMKRIPAFLSWVTLGSQSIQNIFNPDCRTGKSPTSTKAVEIADIQMIEELGRAKGKKMIDKTIEALKKSSLLQEKFKEVVNKIHKEKKR